MLLCAVTLGAFGQTAAIRQILDKMSGEGIPAADEIRSLLEYGIDTQDRYGRSPLNMAAMYRYTDLGKALLEAGANPDTQDATGLTPLMWAISGRGDGTVPDMALASALILAGADLNLKSNRANTALIYASYRHEPKLVRLLIDNGAEVNVVNRAGSTPLGVATEQGYEDIAEMLRQAGAGTVDYLAGIKDIASEGLLKILRENLYTEQIRAIVELLEQGIDAQDGDGNTPLLHAIGDHRDEIVIVRYSPESETRKTQLAIINELIAMKADVNRADNEGRTPLIAAVEGGNPAIIRALVAAGADLSKAGNNGRTPLLQAVFCREQECMDLLLEAGADIQEKDGLGQDALHMAAVNDRFEMAKQLLEKGAKANAKNNAGETPLINAVSHNSSLKMARLLVEYGADINASDTKGQTALMIAALRDNADVVQLLLDHNADVNIANKRGHTAIKYYVQSEKVKEMLIKAGAK